MSGAHRLITTPAIYDALALLVERQPATLRLLLLTRADPPLPLARLRARGQLAEIRLGDLRFTPEEAAAFFRRTFPTPLDDLALQAPLAQTEGWGAGLQLAALSLRGRSAEESAAAVLGLTNADEARIAKNLPADPRGHPSASWTARTSSSSRSTVRAAGIAITSCSLRRCACSSTPCPMPAGPRRQRRRGPRDGPAPSPAPASSRCSRGSARLAPPHGAPLPSLPLPQIAARFCEPIPRPIPR